MTQPMPPVTDTDELPPTQYLILEVLAARYRAGETVWTFPAKLRSHIEQLADIGLIGWKSGIAPKTVIAWLTDAGKAAALAETYEPPLKLLPDGTTTRTEWATRLNAHTEGGRQYDEELLPVSTSIARLYDATDEQYANARAEHWRRRFGAELVDVVRRDIHTTPWTVATAEVKP